MIALWLHRGIERFVKDQEYDHVIVLAEIRDGNKCCHWAWYLFPQFQEFARSSKGKYYGFRDKNEANDYLIHPILGRRIKELSNALLLHVDYSIDHFFGEDNIKNIQSCMTIFDYLSPNSVFGDVLNQFYHGERDIATIRKLMYHEYQYFDNRIACDNFDTHDLDIRKMIDGQESDIHPINNDNNSNDKKYKMSDFFIVDPKRPIIVPFGYACIGKTMLIQRLIRYLHTIGYLVRPELVFRNDPIYPQICEMYMDEVYGKNVAVGTATNGTILLSVIDKNGCPICYVLDIAGEYQHDLNNPLMGLSPEMNYIMNSLNRKIWSFIIEAQSHLNSQERCHYVQKIHSVGSVMRKCDKVAFIININKVDWRLWPTDVSISDLYRFIETDYPHLFEPFMETRPILKLFKPMRFVFLPFTSGTFVQSLDATGEQIECYCEGEDVYPQQLWNNLLKLLR